MERRESGLVEYYYDADGRKVNLWSVMQPEAFFEDVQGASLCLLKEVLQGGLLAMRDRTIGAEPYERTDDRRDHRNGFYVRKRFPTAIGVIEDFRVPRCRNRKLATELKEILLRARGAVEDKVVEMYLKGVSTRNVGELLDGLVGVSVSAGQVSRLAKRLDGRVKRFHDRPLEDRYAYLLLDGVHLKSRELVRLFGGRGGSRFRVALTAYGITHEGIKELIDFRLERTESEKTWNRFLSHLHVRGLTGRRLRLIVTDGGKGLGAAVDLVYPFVDHQRCWFHKMANVFTKVRKANASACMTGLAKVYKAASRSKALRAFNVWARRWRKSEPKAVECVRKDLDNLLAFFKAPVAHRQMVRTTNAIERCFREVRRRTRSIGCFLDQDSIERLLFGLFDFMNQKRANKVCKEFRKKKRRVSAA